LYASSSSSSALDNDDDEGNAATSAIFATCGGPYATIYEIKYNTNQTNSSSSSSELTACQIYHDVDDGEVYYTCAFGGRGVGMPLATTTTTTTTTTTPMKSNGIVNFGTEQQQQQQHQQSSDENQHHQRSIKRQRRKNNDNNRLMNGGPPLLCLGGTRGIIKIIDTTKQALHITLSGHGNDITDLKFSPTNEYYLLSSSKDESIRLWNISSSIYGGKGGGGGGGGVNVAIFAGHVGHRGQVLSIGWHVSGKQFVSGGMDNMIKLWNIGDDTTTTTTKTNDDNSCSNRNMNNNNNATTTTTTATISNTTDQSVIPSNWSNDMDGSCSSSRSSSSRIPSTIQRQQYSRQERDVRTTTFDTVFQQLPYFSTNKVHTNYVGKCFYK
jgi:WD40 repeat protein